MDSLLVRSMLNKSTQFGSESLLAFGYDSLSRNEIQDSNTNQRKEIFASKAT